MRPSDTTGRHVQHAHGTYGGASDTRRGRDTPAQCNGRRSLDLPSMYTTWSDVRHPNGATAENHRFSPAEDLCPFSTPTTERWYQSGEGGSEPCSNPYHSRCNSCRPSTTHHGAPAADPGQGSPEKVAGARQGAPLLYILPDAPFSLVHACISICYTEGNVPHPWLGSGTFCIFKGKGAWQHADRWRPIAMSNSIYRLLMRWVYRTLYPLLSPHPHPRQFGGR